MGRCLPRAGLVLRVRAFTLVKRFMELIDTHCHLHYDYAPKSTADLVREAAEQGIHTLITVGVDIASIEPIQKISEAHERVYHTVGVHPHDAVTIKESDLDTLRKAAAHPKCLAIGEIGLDYYYKHSLPEVQIPVLEQQLGLALEMSLPVVIHSRDAEKDLLLSLTRYAGSCKGIPGIIHCFTGTQAFGEACIALGFYISFSGIFTFKNAEDLRIAAKAFPLDRLLVETDSPYLAPIPFRGRKCEPAMVRFTAQKLAEVKGISFEELALATTQNARRAFSLS